MDKTTEEHLVIGSFVFDVFKDAVLLGDEDNVYQFRREIRAMLHAMYKSTFDPDNRIVTVPYYNGSPDKYHRLNKIGMMFLKFLEMHLVQFGDAAAANMAAKIGFNETAVLGMSSHVKGWNIIEDQTVEGNTKKMVFDVSDMLHLATLEYKFIDTVWRAFEDEIENQNGKIIFYGSEDGLPYDPIIGTKIKIYLWGIKEVYEVHAQYEVYHKMSQTIDLGKRAAQQLVAELQTELNKAFSLIRRLTRALSGEIEIVDTQLSNLSSRYDEVLEKEVLLRNSLLENGAVGEIVTAFEMLVEETSNISEDIDQLGKQFNKITGHNMRVDKKIKEIQDASGLSRTEVLKRLLEQNYADVDDEVTDIVESLPQNGKDKQGILTKIKSLWG